MAPSHHTCTSASSKASKTQLTFGVLLCPHYQWLDAASFVDYINAHSKAALKDIYHAPLELVAKAPIINWHYISSTGTLDGVSATSGPKQIPTVTFENCPPLDYILVPSADPFLELSDACTTFMLKRFASQHLKGLLTICSGSLIMAHTGVLNGLRAASNKAALKMTVERGLLNKKVKWVGDRRWVVDGKVWSSAGVTAGIDLAAEFSRVFFDAALVQMVQEIFEYTPNPAQPDPFAYILKGIIPPCN